MSNSAAAVVAKEKVKNIISYRRLSYQLFQGNAAFKAADYVAAVGHYTAAALADPSDPTFFLNRAAAYLKLLKSVSIPLENLLITTAQMY
jgi:Flp pilus assembly protein TadD